MKRSGIKCRHCGQVNELGKVFCAGCSRRLDLSLVNTKMLARGAEGSSRPLLQLLRLLSLLALCAGIALLLWPVELTGRTGAEKQAKQLDGKIAALARAAASNLYVFEIVSEEEANAFLEQVLTKNKQLSRSQGMQLGIDRISLTFTPEMFTVVMLANWGPLHLTYEVSGRPVAGKGDFTVDIQSVRWGHLPLPGPMGVWMAGRLSTVFQQMKRERGVLDRLERCDLGEGKVRLVTKGARATK